MEPEFIAILEEIVRREGGVQNADRACELTPGTFSRWLNHPKMRPDWPSVKKVALRYAGKLGISSGQVAIAAGYGLQDDRVPRLPADLEIDREVSNLFGHVDDDVRPAVREMVLRHLRDMTRRYGTDTAKGGPRTGSPELPTEGKQS